MDAALKAAVKDGSASFMYGAISGAAVGGVGEAVALHGATVSGLSMNEVALIQKETNWSLETISQIKSYEEAVIYQQAGLKEAIVGGRTMLIRDINLNYESKLGEEVVSNLQRMSRGYAPIDPETAMPYQLHHVNQNPDGVLAILKATEHQPNASILNTAGKEGAHSILGNAWDVQRKQLWMEYAKTIGGV